MSKTFAWIYQQMLNKNCTILICSGVVGFFFNLFDYLKFLKRKYIWRISSLEMIYFYTYERASLKLHSQARAKTHVYHLKT